MSFGQRLCDDLAAVDGLRQTCISVKRARGSDAPPNHLQAMRHQRMPPGDGAQRTRENDGTHVISASGIANTSHSLTHQICIF